MAKLTMHTADIVSQNIAAIGELFPNCVTEGRDENGNPCQKTGLLQICKSPAHTQRITTSEQNEKTNPGKLTGTFSCLENPVHR